jgi:hypothetical protein
MPLVFRWTWEVAVHQVNEEDEQGAWSRAHGAGRTGRGGRRNRFIIREGVAYLHILRLTSGPYPHCGASSVTLCCSCCARRRTPEWRVLQRPQTMH